MVWMRLLCAQCALAGPVGAGAGAAGCRWELWKHGAGCVGRKWLWRVRAGSNGSGSGALQACRRGILSKEPALPNAREKVATRARQDNEGAALVVYGSAGARKQHL